MVKAGPTRRRGGRERDVRQREMREAGVDGAEAAADGLDRQMKQLHRRRSSTMSATNGPGIRGSTRGQSDDDGERERRDADRRRGCTVRCARRTRPTSPTKSAGTAPIRRPEQVLHLAREDDDGDAAGEAGDDRDAG